MTSPASRAARARYLAGLYPEASEALNFYAEVSTAQDAARAAHPHAVSHEGSFDKSLDLDAVAEAFPAVLATYVRVGPAPLSAAADELTRAGRDAWHRLAAGFWTRREDDDPVRAFMAESVLQPFAAAAAATRVTRGRAQVDPPGSCPVCAGRPVVAVLRDQAQGAKRSLVCGFCLTEWPVPRATCVGCGEAVFEKLSVYTAEAYPAARVDTCETCRSYLKSIDLSQDGNAVPLVDDIATVALDLWARGQGYQRIRPNLLRL